MFRSMLCVVTLFAFCAAEASDTDFLSKVKHLGDNDFTEWLESKSHSFVLFYAPWCGHCKALKPDFKKLAQAYSEDDRVAIAAVDCTTSQSVCSNQGVQGYPTLKFFTGTTPSEYSGGRSLSALKDFIEQKLDPSRAPSTPEAEPADNFRDEVTHLSADTFNAWRVDHPATLVMFYAPWCGHCKAMKPEFIKAAKQSDKAALAAVDCTAEGKDLCSTYEVKGFPTIKYFATSSSEAEDYEGGRTAKAIVKYVTKKIDPSWEPEFVDEPLWEENGHVVHLTDEHWDWFKSKNQQLFVFFYAPWCGHCKSAKPEIAAASKRFRANGSVKFVAVDCTENTQTCGRYKVDGYPTIRYFESAEDDNGIPYDGQRIEQSIVNWVENKLQAFARKQAEKPLDPEQVAGLTVRVLRQMLKDRGVDCPGCSEKPDFVARVLETMNLPKVEPKKHKMTWAQEQRMKKAEEHAKISWENGDGNVKRITEFTFDEFRAANPQVLVLFYTDWCGHCKALKPEYVKASLDATDSVFAAIECDNNPTICQKEGVKSYPTLKYFSDATGAGAKVSATNAEGILKYLRRQSDPSSSQEFQNEPVWETNGEVVHLTEDHFATYRQTHPKMLTMFYAPWCGHCKALKPAYAEASTSLKASHPDVVISAVDCTEHGALCSQFDVKGYPTLRWFESSTGKGEPAEPSRTVAGIIEFVETKLAASTETDWFVSEIPHLTQTTLAMAKSVHPRVLVMFYDSACDEAAKKEFTRVKSEAGAGDDAHVAAVNCSKETALCAQFEYEAGSTSFKLFRGKNDSGLKYDGAAKYFALLTFLDLHPAFKDEL